MPLENIEVTERIKVLVTLLPDDGASCWSAASQSSADAVWGNAEDDVYDELHQQL